MNLASIEFEIKQARLEPGDRGGNNIVISMVSVYKDGEYLKHAKLNEELLKAINSKGSLRFNVNLDKLEAMKVKNPHLEKLAETLGLEVVESDKDIIDWFRLNMDKVPLVAIQGSHYTIERPTDFVETHLKYIERFGINSRTAKPYIDHLKDLYLILNK